MKLSFSRFATLASLIVLIPTSALAKVIFVREDALSLGTGSSWATAFPNIHAALSVALPGDQVWVAQGTYHPGSPGDVNASFNLPPGVSLYGGFAGTEFLLSDRDILAHPTILSGDLSEDDVFGNPWWNNWSTNTPNSLCILIANQPTPGTTVDGITVSNATGTYTAGAGISCSGGAIEIRNCIFRRNSSYQTYGTCLNLSDCFGTISNCTFTENFGRFVNGVGIATNGLGGANVQHCKFVGNHADSYISSGHGAGIAFEGSTPSTVTECDFYYNDAVVFGGTTYPSYGGGIYNIGAPLSVDRCNFHSNSAVQGGGIFSWQSLSVSNCKFTENSAGFGGAIGTYFYQNYDLKVTGCTIVNNDAHEVGGVSFDGFTSFSAKVSGCIFWGNRDIGGIHSRAQVRAAESCCIQSLWVPLPGEDPIDPEKFPNCTDANPQFVSASDLRLSPSSPCIDAANKGHFAAGLIHDLDNRARFFDLPSAPNVGIGSGPLPDMGCYESNPNPMAATLEPAFAYSGSGDQSIVVHGAGFTPGSIVRWNGSNRATTYVSSQELSVLVLGSDLGGPGLVPVTVANDGNESNALTFSVRHFAKPDSVAILVGTQISGGLSDLELTDDARLNVRPSFSGSRLDPNAVIETSHACPVPSPALLIFRAEFRATAGPNDFKLQARNAVTGLWETLDEGVTTMSDSTVTVPTTNAARFVSEGTVRVRLWIRTQLGNTSRSWQVQVDQVSVEIRP